MKSYLTLCLLQFFGFIFFNPGVHLSWNCPDVFLDQCFLTVYQGKYRHDQWNIRTYLEEMPKCFFSTCRCTNNNDHHFDHWHNASEGFQVTVFRKRTPQVANVKNRWPRL